MIAAAARPLVEVVPLDASSPGQVRRLGFMTGLISVPDDYYEIGRSEIAGLFGDDDT